MLQMLSQSLSHADLGKSQIEKDETDITAVCDILSNNWVNPFDPNIFNLEHSR